MCCCVWLLLLSAGSARLVRCHISERSRSSDEFRHVTRTVCLFPPDVWKSS
uniref:Uncharacterized protein n=1 Tax=Setaria viridis TaxID=4556 RepID=A0A4U6U5G9_SETVI|nr:hypothetical protein SEVIR_7G176250v2 [Setaria viridis]